MQQGGDKVVTVTRGGDGGVKKAFRRYFFQTLYSKSLLSQSMLNPAW